MAEIRHTMVRGLPVSNRSAEGVALIHRCVLLLQGSVVRCLILPVLKQSAKNVIPIICIIVIQIRLDDKIDISIGH